jgi:hypothetical protein
MTHALCTIIYFGDRPGAGVNSEVPFRTRKELPPTQPNHRTLPRGGPKKARTTQVVKCPK